MDVLIPVLVAIVLVGIAAGVLLTRRGRGRDADGVDLVEPPPRILERPPSPLQRPPAEDGPGEAPAATDLGDPATEIAEDPSGTGLDLPEVEVPELDVPEPDVALGDVPALDVPEVEVPELDVPELDVPAAEVSMVQPAAPPRLRDRLTKTRVALGDYVRGLRRRRTIDDATWDDIEEMLLLADVGVATTGALLERVKARASAEGINEPNDAVDALADEVALLLETREDRDFRRVAGERNVWLFVGVNGVGKTTTIGKFAARERLADQRLVLAAADTFRAAAADQLATWGERVGADVIRSQEGADPGSVVFDAMEAATRRDADLVLVDTAGRLHTKANLMEELKKLRRIIDRTPGALKEVLLVVDATTGQNGLAQARQFAEAVDVTGIVLTKLDGTAKGGIVVAIEGELGIPVKAIGLGEAVEDLVAFDAREFATALFAP